MFGLRGLELVIILIIVVLLFGPSKIPDLARSLGKAVREFKGAMKGAKDEVQGVLKDGDSGGSATGAQPAPPTDDTRENDPRGQ